MGKEFTSLYEAIECFLENEDDHLSWKAWNYIVDNAPPELMETLREGMRIFFPDLKPSHYDEAGTPYYSVEDVAKYLGASTDDMVEILAMDEKDHMPVGELRRVQ